jgi:hypothetical protein
MEDIESKGKEHVGEPTVTLDDDDEAPMEELETMEFSDAPLIEG